MANTITRPTESGTVGNYTATSLTPSSSSYVDYAAAAPLKASMQIATQKVGNIYNNSDVPASQRTQIRQGQSLLFRADQLWQEKQPATDYSPEESWLIPVEAHIVIKGPNGSSVVQNNLGLLVGDLLNALAGQTLTGTQTLSTLKTAISANLAKKFAGDRRLDTVENG